MPLRAFINDREKVSISCSDDEWSSIKIGIKKGETKLELPCCKQNGFLRISSKGLKHFIHAKGQNVCDWKPESQEHLAAKAEVIKACIDTGWEAIPEFSENEWRADVLAKKNDLRIAFEIQWSSQTSEVTQMRQERYKTSNVRGCWFFRTIPKPYRNRYGDHQAVKDLPFFNVQKNSDGQIEVNLKEKVTPLYNFVKSLLNKEIKYCESYRARNQQEIEIEFYETSCWKCGREQHLYTVNDRLASWCNSQMYFIGALWDDDDLDKSPSIVRAIREVVESNPKYKVGEIKKRYSKTVRDSYMSFGCYYCDAIFGDFFLNDDRMEAQNSGRTEIVKKIIDIGDMINDGQHWCYSPERKFCT